MENQKFKNMTNYAIKETYIYWATMRRSYFSLLSSVDPHLHFEGGDAYLTENWKKRFSTRISSSPLLDLLGYFRVQKIQNKDCDYYISFNKFLKCDKPYVLLLEMPEAPGHYSPNRFKNPFARWKLRKCLNDPHLVALVPINRACITAIPEVWGINAHHYLEKQIYVFVPDNPYISIEKIHGFPSTSIRCLFVTTGFRFRIKGGLEVLDAFSRLPKNITLTIITKIDMVDPRDIQTIRGNPQIELKDFTLSQEEMQKEYASHQVLIHVTSDDTSPLTVIEAMKGGEAILSTKIYAIPEMVADGDNGFLTDPKYQPFDAKNAYIYKKWAKKDRWLNGAPADMKISNFIVDKLGLLSSNPDLLVKLRCSSLMKANNGDFSSGVIKEQWLSLFLALQEQNRER